MKRVTVGFHGFWPGFEPDHFLRRHPYLAHAYELVPSSQPDVVFYSVFPDDRPRPAHDHVRVFYTGEYVEPDLDAYDFAISFHRLDDDRHLRLPSYVPRLHWSGRRPHDLVRNPSTLAPAGPRFCNFVYGRSRPERDRIFELVSQVGYVEAPGNAQRNAPPIGTGVDAKLDYLRGFRFTIACENGSAPGYVTEKLVEASLAGSVPIYWGAPDVALDFDPAAFINRHDFPDEDSFVARIRAVAADPVLYETIRARSLLHGNVVPEHMRDETALAFFARIFEAPTVAVAVAAATTDEDVEGFLAPEEFQLLHDLAAATRRGCIVEIGSYRGRSTVALARGARAGGGAPLYAIEPHDEFVGEFGGLFGPPDREAFFRNMLAAGVAQDVHLVNLPSEAVAPGWQHEVGMLWIDGDHRYDAVRRDLECWAPHLAPGAVVVLHDAAKPDLGPARLVEEEIAAGRFERVGGVEQTVVLRRRGERQATPAPPDFVGVGAQKCGTSWWYSLIAQHPGVHDPEGFEKEARFFCEPGPHDLEAYRSLFARPPGLLAGEWTPDYLWSADSVVSLRAAAPDAKLLLLVRDPVERFVSGLGHLLMYDEPIHRRAIRKTYRAGLYGLQARRLLRQFPREQVLLLQYERCVADPAAELARTYAFLGLDPSFVPASVSRPVHETSVEKPILPPRFRTRLVEGYRRDAERLAALFPELQLGLWRSLGYTVDVGAAQAAPWPEPFSAQTSAFTR